MEMKQSNNLCKTWKVVTRQIFHSLPPFPYHAKLMILWVLFLVWHGRPSSCEGWPRGRGSATPDCITLLNTNYQLLLRTYQIVLLWWRKSTEWALVSQLEQQVSQYSLDHTHWPPEHLDRSWASWGSLHWCSSLGDAGGRGQGAQRGRTGGVLSVLQRRWCHKRWRIFCLCRSCAVYGRLELKLIHTCFTIKSYKSIIESVPEIIQNLIRNFNTCSILC